MTDYLKSQEWKNYSVRRYPKAHKPWVVLADLAIMALTVVVGGWTGHYLIAFFAGIGTVIFVHVMAFPIRCPDCHDRVLTRQVDDEPGYRQFFHDCPKCRITWECEKFVVSDS
jgi:hypothetical protein